uniref:Uncharacterized protein n=1 Tax=Ralstonia solanacearum TaxID=305 RepID=A0A0S4TL95_RALSL|nr:protein of unknown function [Ralstonia solanacearum]
MQRPAHTPIGPSWESDASRLYSRHAIEGLGILHYLEDSRDRTPGRCAIAFRFTAGRFNEAHGCCTRFPNCGGCWPCADSAPS